MFNSRSYAIRLKHTFSFNARYKFFRFFFVFVEEFLRSISMRELEYDIDVYVRLDLLVTIVKKVTFKIGEVFFVSYFNTVVYFFKESKIQNRSYL